MDQLTKMLVEKLGIDQAIVAKVMALFKGHPEEATKMLGGDAEEGTAVLEKAGIDKTNAEKVVAFLKDHAGEVTTMLGNDAAQGILGKAKGALGGLFGGPK